MSLDNKSKQSECRKVKVKYYSGYKGEETPRSVFINDEERAIDRLCERKKILDPKTGEIHEEYTIEMKSKKAILKIFSSGESELADLD